MPHVFDVDAWQKVPIARGYRRNNLRRGELIQKKHRGGGLTDAEAIELRALQKWCGEWVSKRHPLPGADLFANLPNMQRLVESR